MNFSRKQTAPVLITVYNRSEHLARCINNLARCKESRATELFIASDAPFREEDSDAIARVRDYISGISGFKRVIPLFRETNLGLAKSYYHAVNTIFESYDRYIFLEDDVLVAPDFLTFMNEALDLYRDEPSVFSVSAFSFSLFYEVPVERESDVYFTGRFYPWGYGQWKHKALRGNEYTPEDVDRSMNDPAFLNRLRAIGDDLLPAFLSERAQSKMLVMDYLHTYHMVRNNLLAVAPYRTKSFNIGHDGSGTRTVKSRRFMEIDPSRHLVRNPWKLVSASEEKRDESFNQAHFRNTNNGLKVFLNRLGLLKTAMKVVNAYRGRR